MESNYGIFSDRSPVGVAVIAVHLSVFQPEGYLIRSVIFMTAVIVITLCNAEHVVVVSVHNCQVAAVAPAYAAPCALIILNGFFFHVVEVRSAVGLITARQPCPGSGSIPVSRSYILRCRLSAKHIGSYIFPVRFAVLAVFQHECDL